MCIFHIKTNTEAASTTAPIVDIRFIEPQYGKSWYVYMRRGIPITPRKCCMKNVILNPITVSQKCHFPSVSDNIRPVNFGNQ